MHGSLNSPRRCGSVGRALLYSTSLFLVVTGVAAALPAFHIADTAPAGKVVEGEYLDAEGTTHEAVSVPFR
jgi:hypothetical protein